MRLLSGILLVLLVAQPAVAQPDSFSGCNRDFLPWCQGTIGPTGSLFGCGPGGKVFGFISGPYTVGPLRYRGPITIEVETYATTWLTSYPLFVEIVPVESVLSNPCRLAGYTVLETYGDKAAACGSWATVGPLDASVFVPLESLYAVRLYSFYRGDIGRGSPMIGCIRVTPEAPQSPVTPNTWGLVKRMYR